MASVMALPGPQRRQRRGEGGFSLLEVLVAFAVLAVVFGVLLQIFAGSAQRATLAESYLKATTLAESRLNAVGAEVPLAAGSVAGEAEEGFRWALTLEPYPLEGLDPVIQSAIPLRVTVTVDWEEGGRRHEVSASTLRVAAAQL